MRFVLLALLWSTVLFACGGGDPAEAPTDREDVTDAVDGSEHDGSGDTPADTAADTVADAPADASLDTRDTPPDTPDGSGADTAPDAPTDTRPPECPELPKFDYACTGSDPATCPEGFCILGLCLAPVVNEARWATCGDGVCDACEVASLCPVDCLPAPTLERPRDFDSPTTVTIEVHGFSNAGSDWDTTVYGAIDGTGGMGELIRTFAPDVPDGVRDPDAPNQMIGVEYYGAVPADWLTEEDVAEIETYDGRTDKALHRYALIVAKFVNWYSERIGATDVNLYCHSMGCHVTRYMIENDLEGVASSGRIARWATAAGVIGGARLARLFDNPTVRDAAVLLPINTWDFIHMNPDYVTDHSAVWDHRALEANNPLFQGMLIHHIGATDPTLQETLDIVPLLDLSNPEDEPNDGLVYTWDESFRAQDEAVRARSTTGVPLLPTTSYQRVDHFELKEQTATGILMAAALYQQRKVRVVLRSIALRNDLERDSIIDFADTGDPPADISFQTSVSYNPYIQDTFGQPGFVHTQLPDDRSTPLVQLIQGSATTVNWTLFEGPVFDDQESIRLDFELLEMDWYPRFGVGEWAFDVHERLIGFDGRIALEDATLVWENSNVRVEVDVRVYDMY